MSFLQHDSQSTPPESAKPATHGRCTICLALVLQVATYYPHLINPSPGRGQLNEAIDFGLVPNEYNVDSEANRIALCPNCFVGCFKEGVIALSPPPQILAFISDYLRHTGGSGRALHEVFDFLVLAKAGRHAEVPIHIPSSILPYVGLYTLIVLKPVPPCIRIKTGHFPPPSVLRGTSFETSADETPTEDQSFVRIFDAPPVAADPPISYGVIPLSPQDPEFKRGRYWRLRDDVKMGAVLMKFIHQVTAVRAHTAEEVPLAQQILVQCLKIYQEKLMPIDGGPGSN